MATVTQPIEQVEFSHEDGGEEDYNSGMPKWSDLDLKYKLLTIASITLLILTGYFISTLLSILLSTLITITVGVVWFSSTDLSVEITVFLGKFFPPSKHAIIDCVTTPECKWSQAFRDNYKVIHNEYVAFEKKYNYCPQMSDVYPNGSITNWDRKWPTVSLRVYGLDTDIAKYFPKTMKLVNDSDTWLSHVMYSILRPSKFIPRHRGPYRGVFRYQLSLEIPPHTSIANELYLAVWPNTSSVDFWSPENVPKGEPLLIGWSDGSDFLFDDTCVHEVINFTKKKRVILFMDVERHDISLFSKLVHRFFMNIAKYLPTVQKCKDVQDGYLKTCVDEKTKEPVRFEVKDRVDLDFDFGDISPSNSWLWYNTAPEILPYKKARVVINNAKKNSDGKKSQKEE